MPSVNWDRFVLLSDAPTKNFEMLCRAIIRCHYGQYGDFRALANQPGIEFHLKLHTACDLGEPGRWYGWQCKWYDLPSGRAIGNTRRKEIKEALAKTESTLPELTDWVLWTRHPLTKDDQQWFCNLPTRMRLHMNTSAEVENLLCGPAAILRESYFGELVFTPTLLADLHREAVAPIRTRWQPEVHQVVNAERTLRRALGSVDAWSNLPALAGQLTEGASAVAADLAKVPVALAERVNALMQTAKILASALEEVYAALGNGDYEILRQQLEAYEMRGREWDYLLRRLRAARSPVVLAATNLVADLHASHQAINRLGKALAARIIAVVADAGDGKTELSIQLTVPTETRPAGILLLGRDLHARQGLDELAGRIMPYAKPVPSFEALAAAVDAAARRAGRRLPIIIDGLNEAQDPRDWKAALASAAVVLERYPFVLLICTLRSEFVRDALPQDLPTLKLPGFERDTTEAIRRYFDYYRIDATDADLPLEMLEHPLKLRMFCEVTNPERKHVVGIEAMPGSLTAVFDRYLDQVAQRIAELSSISWRYYESDVRTKLNEIGKVLWETNARSVDLDELRHRLSDQARPWDQSIVRLLESEGVLMRTTGDREQPGRNELAISYDLLAGHLIADALLKQFGGRDFKAWLHKPQIAARFSMDYDTRHTLATDIFRALVGLAPRRLYRQQLWSMLDEPLRTDALREAALLEANYLDSETVAELAALVILPPMDRRDLFARLQITRGAHSHPLDAEFLDMVLRPLSVADRDLRWSEWLRRQQDEIIEDIQRLERRWRTGRVEGKGEQLRARWVMWTLTSTVRLLRDHATRALYWFGSGNPSALFALTLDALSINDPYVPERMLAACYGVALSLWADTRTPKVRDALPIFANELIKQIFLPGAPYPTRHVLMRDYAIGVIALAAKVAPDCISEESFIYLKPPFRHMPSPFLDAAEISEADVIRAKDAIRMDFGNYTIGKLIPNRRNYDFENPEYSAVLRQIKSRILGFGYLPKRFRDIDNQIGSGAWRMERNEPRKVDRYGKKYSWIAYFEMYGVRSDAGLLPEWSDESRPTDADLDPSFPEPAKIWFPPLPEVFHDTPTDPYEWVANGPIPRYDNLLSAEVIDGQPGPWVLINGFINQVAKDDERRVFSFLCGVLVKSKQVNRLLAAFNAIPYLGNSAIPEPPERYYTYAGEMPLPSFIGADHFGKSEDIRQELDEAFSGYDGKRWVPGIQVEIPAQTFSWESYHSPLNQVSGVTLPSMELCQCLGLYYRQSEWDLYDKNGKLATLYRKFKAEQDVFTSMLSYLRADLMAEYLKQTKQVLVWLVWGERELDYQLAKTMSDKLQEVYSNYRHIHRHSKEGAQEAKP
jgi:hypothetical protein